MPYSHDQPDNVARVERLGTSRTIKRKQYSALRLAENLRELLANPSYAVKAAEIGQIVQAENGVSMACDAIENILYSSPQNLARSSENWVETPSFNEVEDGNIIEV